MGIPKSSKRTGGPTSAAGKQRVALNAVATGAYATHLLLPGEDAEQFAQLESAFIDAFAPADVIEAALVHDLAALAWKKQRLARTEQTHLTRLVTAPITVLEEAVFDLRWPSYAHYVLSRLETLDAGELDLARTQLRTIRRLRRAEITDAILTQCRHTDPQFYTLLMGLAAALLSLDAPDHQDVLTGHITKIDGSSEPFLKSALDQMTASAEAVLWAYPRKDQLQQKMQAIRAQRLVDWFEKAPLQRACDDLHRAFFRTLAELRQQQNWRQRRDAIDVTPSSDHAAPEPLGDAPASATLAPAIVDGGSAPPADTGEGFPDDH